MNEISMALKSAGLKVTPQRIAIYTYLIDTKAHPSVETIYHDLKEDYPAMSLATVYKTVATLRDAHLIQEFNVGEDSHRYDAVTDFHPHLVCTCCHRVYDYSAEISFRKLKQQVKQQTDFEINNLSVNFYGICSECRAEQ
jgi:Fur family peroxide stress response transcriptional regulator